MCPPCVRCVSAVRVRVCLVSTLHELCPACVLGGSAIFALCVRHVSAPCLFFVLFLSACCSLCIRSLSAFVEVYLLGLAEVLSAPCPFFDLCIVVGRALVCFVSSLVRLGRSLWGLAVPLSTGRVVTFTGNACLKASLRFCTLPFVFPFCPVRMHVYSLSGFCLHVPVSGPFRTTFFWVSSDARSCFCSIFRYFFGFERRASANAISFLKTVWGLCWSNFKFDIILMAPVWISSWR